MVWAVDLGVQITDDGRSLYIGSFCPAMTSLSTKPVENVALKTKDTHERKTQLLNGRTVEK